MSEGVYGKTIIVLCFLVNTKSQAFLIQDIEFRLEIPDTGGSHMPDSNSIHTTLW